ncbi:MAG: hypothetical protein WDN44_03565 [Sphingomonas sp.]
MKFTVLMKSILVATALTPVAAFAQTSQASAPAADADQTAAPATDANQPDSQNDIVVMAQRRSERLVDVPISITAFEFYSDAGVFRPGDSVVRDAVTLPSEDRDLGMVDMGEWLFRREVLEEIRFATQFDEEERAMMIGEDDKLLSAMRERAITTACTQLPTLHYRSAVSQTPRGSAMSAPLAIDSGLRALNTALGRREYAAGATELESRPALRDGRAHPALQPCVRDVPHRRCQPPSAGDVRAAVRTARG